MAFSFGALAKIGKMATGGFDEDMLAELAESLGMELSFAGLEPGQFPTVFQRFQDEVNQPGSEVMRLTVRMRDGRTLTGLLVHPQPSPKILS